MATIYKSFASSDAVQTRTLLHESVPITGSIVSGTYNIGKTTTEENIKDFAHGMFQSVYDYPYLSSSANHIFDITFGYSDNSALSGHSYSQNAKKINIYNEFAQVLAGFDEIGAVREFDRDGDLTTGTKMRECIFINFSRLLTKDEIKKGSFAMYFHSGGNIATFGPPVSTTPQTASDFGATTDYRINSPAGEYAILYTSSATPDTTGESGIGLLYYQAGVAVLTASVFAKSSNPPHGRLPGASREAHELLAIEQASIASIGLHTNESAEIEASLCTFYRFSVEKTVQTRHAGNAA